MYESFEFLFQCRVEVDVVHGPARIADNVVMMSRSPLGELVASDAPGPVVRRQHFRFFQYGKRSVERGQGEVQFIEELLGASGAVCSAEGAYHRLTAARVADTEGGESLGDLLIECLHVSPSV